MPSRLFIKNWTGEPPEDAREEKNWTASRHRRHRRTTLSKQVVNNTCYWLKLLTVIHDSGGDILARIPQGPRRFHVQIQPRFAAVLARVALGEKFLQNENYFFQKKYKFRK